MIIIKTKPDPAGGVKNIHKVKLRNFAAFFIVVFSGYYITKLPLSPIYLTILIGYLFYCLSVLYSMKIHLVPIVALPLLGFLYTLFSQPFFKPVPSALVGVLLSYIIFLITILIIENLCQNFKTRLAEKLVFYSISLLLVEAIYRISFPTEHEYMEFYRFKENSIMYQDSNFVGIFILTLLFFLKYIQSKTNKKYKFTTVLLFILLLATMSRASIISLLILLPLYYKRHFFYKNRIALAISSPLIALFLYILLYHLKSIDVSFGTKFTIIEESVTYLMHADLINILFGVGLGNTKEVIGIGAHNYFITFLLECGVLGCIIQFSALIYIAIKSNWKGFIVLVPFLTNGMSLASGSSPWLWVMLALIYSIECNPITNYKRVQSDTE